MDNLMGIAANDWQTLLRENRFAVSPRYWGRAAAITGASLFNSWNRRREMAQFGGDIAKVQVKAPLFIIGHWRSGTTLLHQLLSAPLRQKVARAWQRNFEEWQYAI